MPPSPPDNEGATPGTRASNVGQTLFYLVFFAVLVWLWISPITSSLWVDETGTFWTARGTLLETIRRCQSWPGQSPIYGVIAWSAMQIFGRSELALRLPSLFAMGLTSVFLYRLGIRILDKNATFWAVGLFVMNATVAYFSIDARPYATALAAATAATLLLVRWLQCGHIRDGLGYVFLACLTVSLHYMFGTVLLVHLAFILEWGYKRLRTFRRELLAGALLIAIFLVVLLVFALPGMLKQGRAYAYLPSPLPFELFTSIVPPALAAGLLLGLMLAGLVVANLSLPKPALLSPPVFSLAAWSVIPPLALFLIAFFTPFKVFVPRYYLCAAPGIALLAGWALGGIQPERARKLVFITMAVSSIVVAGVPTRLKAVHGPEDWRDAIETVRSLEKTAPVPVLIQSSYVESNSMDWIAGNSEDSHLFAPLSFYPLSVPIIPLPRALDDTTEAYLNKISTEKLERSEAFIFVGGATANNFLFWLDGKLSAQGFRRKPVGSRRGISVVLFERAR